MMMMMNDAMCTTHIAPKISVNVGLCWKLFTNSGHCNQRSKPLAKFVFKMSTFRF